MKITLLRGSDKLMPDRGLRMYRTHCSISVAGKDSVAIPASVSLATATSSATSIDVRATYLAIVVTMCVDSNFDHSKRNRLSGSSDDNARRLSGRWLTSPCWRDQKAREHRIRGPEHLVSYIDIR